MRDRILAHTLAETIRRSFSTEGLKAISYKAIFLQALVDVFKRHRCFVSTRRNPGQIVEIFQQLLVLMNGKKYSRFPAFGVYDELRSRNAHGPRPTGNLHRLRSCVSPAWSLQPCPLAARVNRTPRQRSRRDPVCIPNITSFSSRWRLATRGTSGSAPDLRSRPRPGGARLRPGCAREPARPAVWRDSRRVPHGPGDRLGRRRGGGQAKVVEAPADAAAKRTGGRKVNHYADFVPVLALPCVDRTVEFRPHTAEGCRQRLWNHLAVDRDHPA